MKTTKEQRERWTGSYAMVPDYVIDPHEKALKDVLDDFAALESALKAAIMLADELACTLTDKQEINATDRQLEALRAVIDWDGG